MSELDKLLWSIIVQVPTATKDVGGAWYELNEQKLERIKTVIAQREQKAERRGASIAATEINRELGLELTTDGAYYLSRHGKAGVLER